MYGSKYEFPKNLRTRKLAGYILIPVLFYSPILIGLATNDPDEGINPDFLLAITMFLSIFVGLFMVVVYSQRPWVIIEDYTMTVENEEFQIKHLAAMSLFMKGRAGLEPTQYIITFNVVEPGVSARRYETHPIRSIKDADALVRDLQVFLPDVPYYDRTPLAEAVATHDRIEAQQRAAQVDEQGDDA